MKLFSLLLDRHFPAPVLESLREDHRRLDLAMLGVVFLHFLVAITVIPALFGFFSQGLFVGGLLAVFTAVSYLLAAGERAYRLIVGMVLTAFSALYVQQAQGLVEFHFHFFLVLPILALYKDIWPVWAGVALTCVHHVLFNYCQVNDVAVFGTKLYVFRSTFGWNIVALHTLYVLLLSLVLTVEILLRRRRFLVDADISQTLRAISATRSLTPRTTTGGPLAVQINTWLDEVHAMAEDMDRAKARAESANRMKSVFLANMSHEIRTPMNAILGYAQLLQRDTSLTPAQHKKIEVVNRAGEHLLTLLNDVLEMSKIEAGRLIEHPVTCEPVALLEGVMELFAVRARAKDLDLRLHIAASVPRRVVVDSTKLRQALLNLVGNAVKFTASGHIIVAAHGMPHASGATLLTFTVTDTGPGLAPDEVARLFRPFVQASAGAHSGGTGLGLSISRQYAQLLGGDITVTSSPGAGATFRLSVIAGAVMAPGEAGEPVAPAAPKPSPAPVLRLTPGHSPVRVLVVDDERMNRELLTAILVPKGFEVRLAVNGLDAVQVALDWHPHAILLDLRLPVMDGYDVVRRIKDDPVSRSAFIVALTASGLDSDLDALFAAGADAFVRKPFDQEVLLATLGERLLLAYDYDDDVPDRPAAVVIAAPAPPLDLAALTPELRRGVVRACETADYEAVVTACDAVASTAPDLAREMRRRADVFDYESLQQLIQADTRDRS